MGRKSAQQQHQLCDLPRRVHSSDLVSYNGKHNEANGEDNRDGNNDNVSSNCGAEGETNDPQILSLRKQQARNFMAILLLSQGVPMILAGDEVLRTQRGNNNGYCQDNELSWFDWALTEKNREMLRFVTKMIAFRKRHPCLMRKHFLTGKKKEEVRLSPMWPGTGQNLTSRSGMTPTLRSWLTPWEGNERGKKIFTSFSTCRTTGWRCRCRPFPAARGTVRSIPDSLPPEISSNLLINPGSRNPSIVFLRTALWFLRVGNKNLTPGLTENQEGFEL